MVHLTQTHGAENSGQPLTTAARPFRPDGPIQRDLGLSRGIPKVPKVNPYSAPPGALVPIDVRLGFQRVFCVPGMIGQDPQPRPQAPILKADLAQMFGQSCGDFTRIERQQSLRQRVANRAVYDGWKQRTVSLPIMPLGVNRRCGRVVLHFVEVSFH